MSMIDFMQLTSTDAIETDVCIVGAGPVGLTLAAEFSRLGIEVLVLESGGLSPSAFADGLNEIESIGATRVMDQTLLRNRGLGGTSRTWSGRIAAFDETDFAARPWVEASGWPISREDYARYLPRTLPHLGGDIADNCTAEFAAQVLRNESCRFDADMLVDYFWSYSRDASNRRDFMRFGQRMDLSATPGTRVLLNATLTHIDTDAEGTAVTGLELTGEDGRRGRIAAKATILCAGGIENARILLASNRQVANGVGNRHDQVGRYLMDHPRGPVASFDPADFERAQSFFGSFRPRIADRRTVLTRGVALSPAIQAREQLLNAAAWISGKISADDPLEILSRILQSRRIAPGSLSRIARQSRLLGLSARRLSRARSPIRNLDRLVVECIVEQPPRAESRITLSERTDALGVPLSKIDWKVGEVESRTVRFLARSLRDESRRLGLPVPRLFDWVEDDSSPIPLPDVAHPMGTTRMSDDPRTGVVDTDCAVHGVSGLFVAGTSVFPTAGHANPTQTALALAIRLADHLSAQLKRNHLTVRGSAAALGAQASRSLNRSAVPEGQRKEDEWRAETGTGILGVSSRPALR